MHIENIEKNFFDNIMYTVMNVENRSKYTVKSKLDIAKFCSQKELHVDDRGRAPFSI